MAGNTQAKITRYMAAAIMQKKAPTASDLRLQHDAALRELRGKLNRFLSGRLRPMLEQAREALQMQPPRVAVSVEMIEMLESEIQDELDWLTKHAEKR